MVFLTISSQKLFPEGNCGSLGTTNFWQDLALLGDYLVLDIKIIKEKSNDMVALGF